LTNLSLAFLSDIFLGPLLLLILLEQLEYIGPYLLASFVAVAIRVSDNGHIGAEFVLPAEHNTRSSTHDLSGERDNCLDLVDGRLD
jgi:hypothetical protein